MGRSLLPEIVAGPLANEKEEIGPKGGVLTGNAERRDAWALLVQELRVGAATELLVTPFVFPVSCGC